jgi:hypothetical protein
MICNKTCWATMNGFKNTAVLWWLPYIEYYYWSTAVRMQIRSKLQYLASPRLENCPILEHIPHAYLHVPINLPHTSVTWYPILLSRHTFYFLFLTTVAVLFWYSCLLGLLASVTDGMSTYVQEPLAIGMRGCMGRYLNEETLVADNGH